MVTLYSNTVNTNATIAVMCAFSNTALPGIRLTIAPLTGAMDQAQLINHEQTTTVKATVELRFQNRPATIRKNNGASQANNQVIAKITFG